VPVQAIQRHGSASGHQFGPPPEVRMPGASGDQQHEAPESPAFFDRDYRILASTTGRTLA